MVPITEVLPASAGSSDLAAVSSRTMAVANPSSMPPTLIATTCLVRKPDPLVVMMRQAPYWTVAPRMQAGLDQAIVAA